MDEERLNEWRVLFGRALAIIDAAEAAGGKLAWSFGGGTVLMLRHRHRFSHDVDIFVPDPQWLGYLSPRLNVVADSFAGAHVESSAEIVGKKLWFRSDSFKARDLFDLATVIELQPGALREIAPLVRDKGPVILERVQRQRAAMQEEFDALEIFHADRSFERCLEILRGHLTRLG